MKLAAEDVEDDEMFVDCDGDFDDVENGASSSSPGKKSELKRPDLKGTFHCSVCAKVFCHSSSLSRHRMQAHFQELQVHLVSQGHH
ncbi:unnamed protein product [Caenorhabditis auriculariae]|uniref:C2H2-type domain-containing protein n=1 Tax=Caenorhabditis auriculariae TaxID=2777116 RepID=A0A8S1GZA4_9PELO|nr:unnamed protein product [Caenorhabditis auriculariae]